MSISLLLNLNDEASDRLPTLFSIHPNIDTMLFHRSSSAPRRNQRPILPADQSTQKLKRTRKARRGSSEYWNKLVGFTCHIFIRGSKCCRLECRVANSATQLSVSVADYTILGLEQILELEQQPRDNLDSTLGNRIHLGT